jgi:large-conductance mechanosensitive channel
MITFLAATPTPVPTFGAYTGDPDLISPGSVGFIITFLVAAATILLVIDMVRRVRRVSYREQIREKLDAEQTESNDAP